ncbi:MAG TPA: TRAP transporter substrate-binding protein [Thermodesulfobacteriota bacterium]|nr:TRAP transporter substrate-binding protein [Thermodesulfobacteriota bacterium]
MARIRRLLTGPLSRTAAALGVGVALAAVLALALAPRLAPAQQQQPIVLKMQSTWPTQDIFHQSFVDWAKKVEEMSGGRLKIDVLPAGAVVPAFELLDAVNRGVLDGGHGVPAYWFGKNRAASLFGTGPSFGMDAEDLLAWYYYGGGFEMYHDLLQKELRMNVVSFLTGPMPTQPLGWFRNPVRGPQDLQRIKYRTVGLSADLYKELGASVVILPGGEIVPALERGVIDAAEFNNPTSDLLLGFPDVRKVYMTQSFHQPVETLEILFNKTKYDSLPKDLQAIIKYATLAESQDFSLKMIDRNSKDLLTIKQRGVRVVTTPRSVLEAQLAAWDKIIERESKANPTFDKIVKSQREWAKRVVPLKQAIQVDNRIAVERYWKSEVAGTAAAGGTGGGTGGRRQ